MGDFDRIVWGTTIKWLLIFGVLFFIVGGGILLLDWLINSSIGAWAASLGIGDFWNALDNNSKIIIMATFIVAFVLSVVLLPIIVAMRQGRKQEEKQGFKAY